MKKLLFAAVFASVTFTSAWAQPVPGDQPMPSPPPHFQGPHLPPNMTPEAFAAFKLHVIKMRETQLARLQAGTACIQAAQTPQALQACHDQEREALREAHAPFEARPERPRADEPPHPHPAP